MGIQAFQMVHNYYEMKFIFTSLSLLFFLQFSYSQDKQYVSLEDIDPEAKAIMDIVKNKYNGYTSLEASFTMETKIPDQEGVITQEGKVARAGSKYFMFLGDIEVFCNGKAIWYVMKNNEEVQINDLPDSEESKSILSPESMFNFYTTNSYVYALTAEIVENKQPIQQIEFKPLDRNSDYFKLRMSLHKKTKDITRIEAFSKDGSRYNIKVNKLEPNKNYLASVFEFDKTKYPNYYIEDLRE